MEHNEQEIKSSNVSATQKQPEQNVNDQEDTVVGAITEADLARLDVQVNGKPVSEQDELEVFLDGVCIDKLDMSIFVKTYLEVYGKSKKYGYVGRTKEELDMSKPQPEPSVEEVVENDEPGTLTKEQWERWNSLKVGDTTPGTSEKILSIKVNKKQGVKYIKTKNGITSVSLTFP